MTEPTHILTITVPVALREGIDAASYAARLAAVLATGPPVPDMAFVGDVHVELTRVVRTDG